MLDNANASRMAELKDQAISSLSGLTPSEFYSKLVTDIGQQLFIKQMQKDNIELVTLNLANQQGEISGVDINEEAARLLIFEQMFQAMAKYISTLQITVSSVMELI
jgi:flagellar hook-associated protein 1 FlgK